MHELSLAEMSRHAFCSELGVDLTQKLSPLSTDLYHMRQTLGLALCAQFTRQDNQGCISPQARNRPLSTFDTSLYMSTAKDCSKIQAMGS